MSTFGPRWLKPSYQVALTIQQRKAGGRCAARHPARMADFAESASPRQFISSRASEPAPSGCFIICYP